MSSNIVRRFAPFRGFREFCLLVSLSSELSELPSVRCMVCLLDGGSWPDAVPVRPPGPRLSEAQAGPLGGARGLLGHIALPAGPSVWCVVLQQVR